MAASDKKWQIFNLGTNNWQGKTEFAPGSGILHEGHHNGFFALPHVAGRCYSMWPSRTQKADPTRKDYRVIELDHDIPICESVGPSSSYRWHSMSHDEFTAYTDRITKEVLEYLDDVEKETGMEFNLFIAHHTFTNPAIMVDVNNARMKLGKKQVPLVVFSHGTAMKMYQNEINKLVDFPSRFLPWMNEKGVFAGSRANVQGVFVVAKGNKQVFQDLFPEFPKDKVIVSRMGYNEHIFRPIPGATKESVLSVMPPFFHAAFDAKALDDDTRKALGFVADGEGGFTTPTTLPVQRFKKVVVFTGRFADWKRLDVLLHAAAKYSTDEIATVIMGSGSPAAQKLYQDMAYVELKLKNVFFLGPQAQGALAKVNTIADVGIFPSKDEPFGLVFIEMMACGTPVIGAHSGGPRDFVDDSVGHLFEESDDHAVLADRVAAVITKAIAEDWKKNKGPHCQQYAETKFSLVTQCESILDTVHAEFMVPE